MIVNKTCVVSCALDTYSGYGARSRDFVKALIKSKPDWDIKFLSQRWGNTRFGYLEDHNETDLQSRIIDKLQFKPDVWFQITVPNEFQQVGNFNIGVTAAMETDISPAQWIDGVNRMDLTLVSSEHSKNSLINSAWKDQSGRDIKVQKPVEVLFEGLDLDKYFPTKTKADVELNTDLDQIKESFCFLYLGHWLQGDFGQDRKNTGVVVERFLQAFKNTKNPPALIMKTQSSSSSISDRNAVLKKINSIRKSVKGKLPNIYLLHGEVSDTEINELYNHPKVKAMVTFAKGEGFNRPLLEFTAVNKPVIASAWSGHMDFLDPEFTTLIPGQLTPVHKSAQVKDMILAEAKWFTPNLDACTKAYKDVWSNYKPYKVAAKRLGYKNRNDFSFDNMSIKLGEYLDNYMKNVPQMVGLNIPTLTKLK